MIVHKIRTFVASRLSRETKDRWHARIAMFCKAIGYDQTQWMRRVQVVEWLDFVSQNMSSASRLLEISPGTCNFWRNLAGAGYRSVEFPEFDICKEALPETFDIIIAEHVFEHLPDADAAARNVRKMISNDGVFLIATPFMVKMHGSTSYGDFQRWTPEGLRLFLIRNGFRRVEVKSWGNEQAVRANLRRWVAYGWGHDLSNHPDFPLNIWAYARA